jgi:hypothetical protein
MRLTSTGLGIGTTAPATTLEVNGTSYVTDLLIRNNAGTPSLGTSPWLYSPASGALAIATNASERVRIDSSGRLLVGTSTALGTNNSVTIKGTASSNPSIFFGRNENASGITAGEGLGFLEFGSGDGGIGAQIEAEADGTWSSVSDCPSRLVFSTTADGASSPTERMRIANNGAISTVVPGGSTLYPAYDCRAWVNFNGTGTVAIRASGNVSSITDNGIGQFVVNFTNAMPDANYSVVASAGSATTGVSDSAFGHLHIKQNTSTALQSGSVALHSGYADSTNVDYPVNTVAIFR